MYAFLVGPPGIGKSRTISAIGTYLRELEGFHLAPTSMTGASLIDALAEAKVDILYGHQEGQHRVFNSMLVMPDELSALMHEYDRALVATLTTFYDCLPYSQTRRVAKVNIEITHPQLSILAGDTTSHLLKTLPEGVWDQGLMSRTLLIYADDRTLQDDIFVSNDTYSKDLAHDLHTISTLQGQLRVSDSYRNAYNTWRKADCPPKPTHPRLQHYCSRRASHMLKLSIIASVDRSDELLVDEPDFNRALEWLLAAEQKMPSTFQVTSSIDSRAMEELLHFVKKMGAASEAQIVRFACERVPSNTVQRMMQMMVSTRMLVVTKQDQYGMCYYKAEG
jgi:hypothetical protein